MSDENGLPTSVLYPMLLNEQMDEIEHLRSELDKAEKALSKVGKLPNKWRNIFTMGDGYLVYRTCADELQKIISEVNDGTAHNIA